MTSNIRFGALEGFRDLIYELGRDPANVLAAANIDPELWKTPDAFISTQTYRRALNVASDLTKTPRFGLLLSQRQSFDKMGGLGYLVKHAESLRAAIKQLIVFFPAHDSGTVSELEVEEGIVLWTYTLTGLGDESGIQQTDLGLGLALKFFRNNIDPDWSPDAVYFQHSRPANIRLYERIFRCPVFFDHDKSSLEFPESDLDRPLIFSDPKLHKILFDYVSHIRKESGKNLISKVRAQILLAINSGHSDLDTVAHSMSMTRSDMQRKLKRENTNFQNLLEDVRFELARKYLTDTELPLSTITVMLDYAEPAVFTRAFKRFSGQTPRSWRKQHQSPSAFR